LKRSHDIRNVSVLFLCQTLFNSGRSLMFITSPLIGFAIAPSKAIATLPVALMVIGTVIASIPVSLLLRRVGWRMGFVIGGLIGLAGAGFAVAALIYADFWLLCIGALLFGFYSGFAAYYQFAAADSVPFDFKSNAISLVLAGGVVAAFVGPELAKQGKDLIAGIDFLGAYLFLLALTLATVVIVLAVDIPALTAEQSRHTGRPMREIMRQPMFIVAVLSATAGYAMMSLLMTATPLAMARLHPFGETAFVIAWHIFAMYAPGFATGSLIRRFGGLAIVLAGMALQIVAALVGLSGQGVLQFWVALFLLGIGWNFAFTGGSTLLTEIYTPSERAKCQAAFNFIVFGVVSVASLSSGTLFYFFGWEAVSLGAIPVLAVALVVTVVMARRHTPAPLAS
jgi:MFS family permease